MHSFHPGLVSSLARYPKLLLVGPRGCGKTHALQALSKRTGRALFLVDLWESPVELPRADNVRIDGTLAPIVVLDDIDELTDSQVTKALKIANKYPWVAYTACSTNRKTLRFKRALVEQKMVYPPRAVAVRALQLKRAPPILTDLRQAQLESYGMSVTPSNIFTAMEQLPRLPTVERRLQVYRKYDSFLMEAMLFQNYLSWTPEPADAAETLSLMDTLRYSHTELAERLLLSVVTPSSAKRKIQFPTNFLAPRKFRKQIPLVAEALKRKRKHKAYKDLLKKLKIDPKEVELLCK